MDDFALQLREIVKTYPGGVRALDGVDLTVRPRELHALCGENGAGKTTLAAIAAARLRATRGRVTAAGAVGFVPQHPQLVERMRVWENVVLGREPRRGLRLDAGAARERVRNLSTRFALPVDADARIESLDAGAMQRVEILRELAREPALLILDEPTAALAPGESDALFATLQTLAASGAAILVVTHDLGDIAEYAERITVLRAGRVAARFERGASASEIARAMVGGELPVLAARLNLPTAPCFEVRALSARAGADALHDFDLDVRAGEIVGIAGVEGNGQRALADAVAGLTPYRGTVRLDGRELTAGDPAARIAAGLRTIPRDRQREGLVLDWTLAENLALGDQRRRPLRRGLFFDRAAARARARDVTARFDVRAPSLEARASALSGGNQQKLLAGRALAVRPRLLLACEPTRGIDVGAAALLRSRVIEARNAGVAVLLVSLELDELFELADRIVVLFRGARAGEFARDGFDRARVGAALAGVRAG
jgi:simple sugar transport system ATP-binding protein